MPAFRPATAAATRALCRGLLLSLTALLSTACSEPAIEPPANTRAPDTGTDLRAPGQLGLCASCHGRDGIAVAPDTPNLAGRPSAELLAAMQAYLDGSRQHAPMRAMLGPIRAVDREALAEWFAAQPAPVAPSP